MFETLQKATLDKIFVLMAEYAADPRTNKIDLGVGVYKDDKNNTPIMSSVRKAEQRILDAAKTKTYKGVVGNKEFSAGIVELTLGGVVDSSRIRAVNGAGGTGALMILMHVLGRARPGGGSTFPTPAGRTTGRWRKMPVSCPSPIPISTQKPGGSISTP